MATCGKLKSHPFCFGIGRRVFNVLRAALPVERQVVMFELISCKNDRIFLPDLSMGEELDT